MSHRNPDINNPELAAILAELVTTKVQNPPRGYSIVERIGLPDGSVLHESSQYSFAPVVASWLKTHGYHVGRGAVAAYKALELYLASECGMGCDEVQAFRRRAIAHALVVMTHDVKVPHNEQIHARTFHMGDRYLAGFPAEHPGTLWASISAGTSDIDALARAVDRLTRCGYRVGMSQATTVALLDEDGGPDWKYRPTEADKLWIADFERRRPRPEALADPVVFATDSRAFAVPAARTEDGRIEVESSLLPHWVHAWNLDLAVTIDRVPIVSSEVVTDCGRSLTRFALRDANGAAAVSARLAEELSDMNDGPVAGWRSQQHRACRGARTAVAVAASGARFSLVAREYMSGCLRLGHGAEAVEAALAERLDDLWRRMGVAELTRVEAALRRRDAVLRMSLALAANKRLRGSQAGGLGLDLDRLRQNRVAALQIPGGLTRMAALDLHAQRVLSVRVTDERGDE